MSLSQRYALMAQDLRSSLPSTCPWLGSEDVDLISERPISAGGFANLYEATHNDRKVALKSYRCYTSFDIAQVIARFRNEIHIWTLLHHGDVEVVPLVGVYSTEAHPFGLVYEYMDGLDLWQYLRNEPYVERVKLLVGIARGLNRIHDLGIVHGSLRTTNVLVGNDGTVRIAGLGSVSILPHLIPCAVEGQTSTDRLSRSCAPELTWPGVSPNLPGSEHPTKASDVYAFGVMAWEVLTGLPPFSDMSEITAAYSMLSGARPPRPADHHEISDRVWYVIERCWHKLPSRRMPIGEAVDLLEAESG